MADSQKKIQKAVQEVLDAADFWYQQGNIARSETYGTIHRYIKGLEKKVRVLEALQADQEEKANDGPDGAINGYSISGT